MFVQTVLVPLQNSADAMWLTFPRLARLTNPWNLIPALSECVVPSSRHFLLLLSLYQLWTLLAMARRSRGGDGSVRGPTSALTNFLAVSCALHKSC